jgi:hypothetical protein
MKMRARVSIAFTALLAFGPTALRSQTLTAEQKEQFLLTAHIDQVHAAKKGVTNTVVVTLSDGTITHDASVQRIDEYKPVYQTDRGTETNFRDTYKFNIAGWRLAKLLGLDDMVPPSVERKFDRSSAAFTWWIDDVMMDEGDRAKKKMTAPDPDKWNAEMFVVRVFDQLIFNVDRNLQNLMIDKQWRIWMIDHTRAFRLHKNLRTPKDLETCDRSLLAKMKALDQPTLEKAIKPYLNSDEIKSLLARRDVIVKLFEAKGEAGLYDRPSRL